MFKCWQLQHQFKLRVVIIFLNFYLLKVYKFIGYFLKREVKTQSVCALRDATLQALVVTRGYLGSCLLPILTSDPGHQRSIFLLTAAAHWIFSVFLGLILSKARGDCDVVKIPVDQQQFVNHSDQPVWHQLPCSARSKSLQSLFSSIPTRAFVVVVFTTSACLNALSRFTAIG